MTDTMVDVETVDGVRVLTMRTEQNGFNLPFVTALADALASAADPGGPLVLTGAGKFFSYGLDLEWLGRASPGDAAATMQRVHAVLAQLLAFPGATVAAVNGHAFGAGAILAAAADYRVMRADRGYFCFPEVDLGLAMSDEFDAVLRAKYEARSLLEGLLTGRRFGGVEARGLGFVDAVADEDKLVLAAIEMVRDLTGKDPATVRKIKRQLHRPALVVLGQDG